MKTSKSLILASFFAMALSSMASAATFLRLTGSTAFRAETTQAIIKALGGNTATFAFSQNATNTATIKNASQAIIYNSTQSIIVKTSWSGSVAGLQALTTGADITTFLNDATYNPVTGTVKATAGVLAGGVYSGGTSIPSGTAVFEAAPGTPADVALSDNFPSDVVGLNITHLAADNQVGVVFFEWVKNVGAPADITNVTNSLAQSLLTLGAVPQSLFSGNNAETTNVFIVGRDNLSGSRYITFAETGFGINSFPTQNTVTPSGATVGQINPVAGATGYSSGGLIASALILTGSDNAGVGGAGPGWLVAYLGTADAQTAISGGGSALTYNGAAATTGNVQNGVYSLWGYEHFNILTTLAGVQLTTANAISSQLTTVDAADFGAGVLISSMNVNRSGDGAPIFHN
jgi:hypothetical protein